MRVLRLQEDVRTQTEHVLNLAPVKSESVFHQKHSEECFVMSPALWIVMMEIIVQLTRAIQFKGA